MQILQTATAYFPSVGGAQLHWYTIAQHLRRRGHQVEAIAQWKDQRRRYLLDSTLCAPWGDEVYDADGIQVHRVQPRFWTRCWMAPLLPLCFLVPALGYAPMAAWFARRFAAVAGPTDVIHNIRIGREHLSWASYRLARRRGVPFFITPNFSPRMQTRSGRFLMRNLFELLRRADGVFVFTPAEFEALQRLGVGAERLCEIGVGPLLSETHDAEGFRKAHGINGRMVLFLGQKLPYKGFDTLIAAAPLVWRKFPDTSFVFIGPHYDRSQQIIRSLGDQRVVDIPRVDPFDPLKASALAAADVFALPSRQEGIGGVYIEAWAMKKPVIACRIPFLTIRDGVDGYLVPQEAAPLAERIIELLANPDRAREMGAAGHARVQHEYNWESIVSRIEAFYEKTTAAARSRA